MSVMEARQEIQPPRRPINVPEEPVELNFDVSPKKYLQWKAGPERLLAALLLVPALPVIGILIALVRATSRGPGIYRQVRTGLNGEPFTMLKIRTMAVDAETGSGAVWTRRKDVRVTRVGAVLRKLHLDEFPQLFNVLRGEMSLIGPRPERPEFVNVLGDAVPGYVNRLAVRPGITGLAQINLPPDNNLNDVRRKLALDMAYVDEAGPWLDIRMFLCTVVRVVGIPGDVVTVLFRLRRDCLSYCKEPGCCSSDEQETAAALTPAEIQAVKIWGNGNNVNGNCNSCQKPSSTPDFPPPSPHKPR